MARSMPLVIISMVNWAWMDPSDSSLHKVILFFSTFDALVRSIVVAISNVVGIALGKGWTIFHTLDGLFLCGDERLCVCR